MLRTVSRRLSQMGSPFFPLSMVTSRTLNQVKSVSCLPSVWTKDQLQRRRLLHNSASGGSSRASSSSCVGGDVESISITFVEGEGETTVEAPLRQSLLEAARIHGVKLEGRCEGSLRCSTCHVIVESQEVYDALEDPSEDELEMLDCTFRATKLSRLACQIFAEKHLDGLKVRLPGVKTRAS